MASSGCRESIESQADERIEKAMLALPPIARRNAEVSEAFVTLGLILMTPGRFDQLASSHRKSRIWVIAPPSS